jgi:hypothetical protein
MVGTIIPMVGIILFWERENRDFCFRKKAVSKDLYL